ncbi:hypothetical protein LCGC14_2483680 [marine sediment metagenome]|uniref:Uncharacterized protein n=1 Tax=marine sediment metagenome TaxID=412755 RepID=A0A0F9DIS3_9ZZZZ
MAQPTKGDSQLALPDGTPLIAVSQSASIAAAASGGAGATAGAFNSATERDAAIQSINDIISVLEANGFIADN